MTRQVNAEGVCALVERCSSPSEVQKLLRSHNDVSEHVEECPSCDEYVGGLLDSDAEVGFTTRYKLH